MLIPLLKSDVDRVKGMALAFGEKKNSWLETIFAICDASTGAEITHFTFNLSACEMRHFQK